MKIYISADFEGINGVSRFSQIEKPGGREYNIAVEQLHKEVNTVANAAFKAGADYVTINDAHSAMTNIDLTKLNSNIELITGKPKQISMMAGLDSSYAAAILLGYHAKAGSIKSCMPHTFSTKLESVFINKVEVGEAYINSLYAGALDVPIAMITGDKGLYQEVYDEIGDVPFVEVKQALSSFSVFCKSNDIVLKDLEETCYKSLTNPTRWIINKLESPYELEVVLSKVVMADLIELMPEIKRIDAKRVKYTNADYFVIYKTLQSFCAIINNPEIYN